MIRYNNKQKNTTIKFDLNIFNITTKGYSLIFLLQKNQEMKKNFKLLNQCII